MNQYPNHVKENLFTLINEMNQNPMLFVKNPEKDFTRERKLSFSDVVKLLISMGGNSIYKELLESQGYDVNTPTSSAFVQQRNKILPCAFEFLLHEFTKSHTETKTYRGYRLLAADGSDLHISTNPNDTETFVQTKPERRGYNLLNLNALYDLCNRLYVDALVQPNNCKNEKKAIVDMVDRSRINGKTILICDRAYESWNIFAHIEEKDWNYVIRIKDLDSTGILSALPVPANGVFDVCFERILTRKQTNETKRQPEVFKYISHSSTFDFLGQTKEYYPISFRVVRFKIADDSYETLITNLKQEDFPLMELKALYKMRWGIETSFRELKYAVGLINFHSKKREYIVQEIFARMIMYNFAEMITAHVVISKAHSKHAYQVNFTIAIHICRHFLRLWSNAPPPNVEALIRKNILPIRPGRTDTRKTRHKTAVSFIYRIA